MSLVLSLGIYTSLTNISSSLYLLESSCIFAKSLSNATSRSSLFRATNAILFSSSAFSYFFSCPTQPIVPHSLEPFSWKCNHLVLHKHPYLCGSKKIVHSIHIILVLHTDWETNYVSLIKRPNASNKKDPLPSSLALFTLAFFSYDGLVLLLC